MKHALRLIGILMLVPSLCIAGTMTSLNKDEVANAFSDKTITTISATTLNGKVINNPFSGYLAKDGKASGSFESKPEGEAQTDTGTWKVDANGMFCTKWAHWDSGKEKCLSIYKLSNGFLVINHEKGFESMILSEQIKSGNQMDGMTTQ